MKKFKTLQELFKNPKRWTRYVFGQTCSGINVDPRNRYAVRWCLEGGVVKVYGYSRFVDIMYKIRNELKNRIDGENLNTWNDSPDRRHRDIVKLVTKLDI